VHVAVLTNCASGARAAPQVRTRRIANAFNGTGIRPRILCVPGHQIATTAADAATRADVVVAAGGDGTVGAVASALAGTDVAMAVLPMGTLNHFARDAGIPLDLEAAAQAMVDASLRQAVDVAEVNGHVFVNNSSIGPTHVRCTSGTAASSAFQASRGELPWSARPGACCAGCPRTMSCSLSMAARTNAPRPASSSATIPTTRA